MFPVDWGEIAPAEILGFAPNESAKEKQPCRLRKILSLLSVRDMNEWMNLFAWQNKKYIKQERR